MYARRTILLAAAVRMVYVVFHQHGETTMQQAPAHNIPDNFTGVVVGSYGDGTVFGHVNGEVLRGPKGGLRKFKSVEAAAKAVAKAAWIKGA
jgi:hypothetical protein